ncbi:unnamed protein product [Ilex paraguariensis]|uniref:Uncharacterized protein n=1 Tax=Ilex paraguariensis TaxID=185542 RepID=A0ABC8RV35_9AQUA
MSCLIRLQVQFWRPDSSFVNFERDFNLFSLDENPFSQLDRRASLGGPVESDPCLHAKRILVLGSPVRTDTGLTSTQGSDQINVPIEAEGLTDNDLVLEQYLSPASPMLAGFRLDGFSAIKL